MLNNTTALLALLLAIAIGIALTTRTQRAHAPIRARLPLTKREQPMYFRLRDTFPEEIVLAQVAFSALLDTRRRATRNRFDKKVADFVLCSRAFEVLAVIELDDSSHDTKRARDRERDAMLTAAGYRVLRFATVPDSDLLKRSLKALMPDAPGELPVTHSDPCAQQVWRSDRQPSTHHPAAASAKRRDHAE